MEFWLGLFDLGLFVDIEGIRCTWLSALIIFPLAKAAFEACSYKSTTASLAYFSSAAASSAYFYAVSNNFFSNILSCQ
jgi:hypothetical protein